MNFLMPFLILALGLLAIFTEFFVPGGIFTVIGVLLILSSMITFASVTDSLLFNFLFFCFSLFAIYLACKFALWKISRGALSTSIVSEDNQEGFVASAWDKDLVGKKGIVVTELRPGGRVRVDDKNYMAISKSRFIERGEGILVVGGEGETLFVMPDQ